MRKYFMILMVLLPLLLSGLTLEEAIDGALANNHGLQREREEIEVYNQKYYAARGMLLPQLSLQGQYRLSRTRIPESSEMDLASVSSRLDDEPENMSAVEGVIWDNQQTIAEYLDGVLGGLLPESMIKEGSLAGGIQLNQTLFSGGKLLSGIKIADRVRNMQKDKYKLTRQEVVYETIRQYYGVKLAKEVLKIQREAMAIAGEHLADVQEMYAQGLVSEYDKLRAELEYRRLEPEVMKAEQDLELIQENFCDYIGCSDLSGIELETEFELPEGEDVLLGSALEKGLEERIELQLSELNVRIQEVLVKMEKADFYPQIGLTASYNYYTVTDDYGIEKEDFGTMASVGLGFRLPLFTGLTRISEVREAQVKVRQAEESESELQEMVKLDIRNAWQQLAHSREILKVQSENVDLAQRGFEIAEVRYASSQGTELEIADAQLMLKLAKLSYSKAVYDVILAETYFMKAMGINLYKTGKEN